MKLQVTNTKNYGTIYISQTYYYLISYYIIESFGGINGYVH